jgi:type I restriction enzyme M protein
MLTNSELRAKVDQLWDKLWAGGLSNPLDSIEQISFLLFMKRLDEEETRRERLANLRKQPYTSLFIDATGKPDPELRWSHWTQRTGQDALDFVRSRIFPFIKTMGGSNSSFALQMENAEFKINKPSLLLRYPAHSSGRNA